VLTYVCVMLIDIKLILFFYGTSLHLQLFSWLDFRFFFLSLGATAPPPPIGPGPYNDSSGRVISSPQTSHNTHNTQHSQHTEIHAPEEIRTHNISWWADADLRLRTLGKWGRHYWTLLPNILQQFYHIYDPPFSMCATATLMIFLLFVFPFAI